MPRNPAPLSVSTPLEPSPRAPWLGLVGILMLLLVFAQHNAWFGLTTETWPWEEFAAGPLLDQVGLALWVLVGLWCLALGFTGARRTRVIGCLVLALPLLTRMSFLLTVLSAAALGAGLLVAREPATRGRGRILATVGALLLLWSFALPRGSGYSLLLSTIEGLGRLFGDDAPTTQELFGDLLPSVLLLLATLGGLLAGLGLTGRRTLAAWFFLLLGGWLLMAGAAIWWHESEGIEGMSTAAVAALVVSRLLLWSFALFTTRDLANLGGGEA